MNLKDILSISGKGGLFKFISQGRTGIIVESFEDKKRTVVHSSAKVSALKDIAIFTETEEVPLGDIFKKIYEKENGKKTINHKSSSEELKAFMAEILPEYDKERVYVSDIKKLVQWYNLLVQMNLLKPEEEEKEEKEEKEKKKEGKDEKAPTNIKEKAKVTAKPKTKTVAKIKPSVKEKSVKTNIPRQKAK